LSDNPKSPEHRDSLLGLNKVIRKASLAMLLYPKNKVCTLSEEAQNRLRWYNPVFVKQFM